MAKNWMKIRALPEVGECVLVTINNEEPEVVSAIYTKEGKWIYSVLDDDGLDVYSRVLDEDQIIAWISMPKPFKE